MTSLDRITFNPAVLNGKACIRGMRISVSLLLNLLANDISREKILSEYPALQAEDVDQCLKYAADLK